MVYRMDHAPGGFVIFTPGTDPIWARQALRRLHNEAGYAGKPYLLKDKQTGQRGGIFGAPAEDVLGESIRLNPSLPLKPSHSYIDVMYGVMENTVRKFREMMASLGYRYMQFYNYEIDQPQARPTSEKNPPIQPGTGINYSG